MDDISHANGMRSIYLAAINVAMQDDVEALRTVTEADRATLLP